MAKNKNTPLEDGRNIRFQPQMLFIRTLTQLKVMAAFVSIIICGEYMTDMPLAISSAQAQESVTITCDRPTKDELFPTWSQAERDDIPGPGLDESAYAQFDNRIAAIYQNTNLFGQSIYQETLYADDLRQWVRGDLKPSSKDVLDRNQRMKLLSAQMKVLEANKATFDIVRNIDVGIDSRYLTRLKQKFGGAGLANEIESNYQNAAVTPVAPGTLSIIKKVTAKLRTITVEDCASKVSDQKSPPNPITCEPLTKEDIEKGLSLPKGSLDPVPGPGLDDNAYTAFNQKVMALYPDTTKVEHAMAPGLIQKWARNDPRSQEGYENSQKIKLLIAQRQVLENNQIFFDVQSWLQGDRNVNLLQGHLGEEGLSQKLSLYFNDPNYQYDRQKYPNTLYKVGIIVGKLKAVEDRLVACPTPAAPPAADPSKAPVAADPTTSPVSANAGSSKESLPSSKPVSTLTGLSGTLINTTCDPLTKNELTEGFPFINVFFILNPKGRAAWDKIPDINQPETAYAEIDKQIDDLANLAISAMNDSATAPTGGDPQTTTPSKPVVDDVTVINLLNANAPQLAGMKPNEILKKLVRGKLTPEQNQTIRVMLAQLQVLFSDKNMNAMQDLTKDIPVTVDKNEIFKQLGTGLPDNALGNLGQSLGTANLSQNLQPLIDAARQNADKISIPLDIDKLNTFINGITADIQAIKPVPCAGPKCDDPQPAEFAPIDVPCARVLTDEVNLFFPKNGKTSLDPTKPQATGGIAAFQTKLDNSFDDIENNGIDKRPKNTAFYTTHQKWGSNSLSLPEHQLFKYTLNQLKILLTTVPTFNFKEAYTKYAKETGLADSTWTSDKQWIKFYDQVLTNTNPSQTGNLIQELEAMKVKLAASSTNKLDCTSQQAITTIIAQLKRLRLVPGCADAPVTPPPPAPTVDKTSSVTTPPAVTPQKPVTPAQKPVTPPAVKPTPKPTATPPAPKPAVSACPMMKRGDIFTALNADVRTAPKVGSSESVYAAFDKNINTAYNRNNSKGGTSHYNLLRKAVRGIPLTAAENKAVSQTLLNTLEGSAKKAPLPEVYETLRQSLKGCK